jgi:phage/plasmid primase-like uncharacterized protein
MPIQAGRCECCGEYDYLEFVFVKGKGMWLCKYCKT